MNIHTWWHHQMETFSALLGFCVGNLLATGEFPSQRLMTRSFDVFFDMCLNKQLSKQSWGWWFEMPSCSLWCYCNETGKFHSLGANQKWNSAEKWLYLHVPIHLRKLLVNIPWKRFKSVRKVHTFFTRTLGDHLNVKILSYQYRNPLFV